MNLRKQVYGSLGYLFYGDNCCVVAWFLISLIAPLISRFSAKLCRQNAFGFDIKSWSKVKQPKSQTAAQQSSRQDTSKCCSQRRLNKQQADNQTARQTKEAWKGVCLSWFIGATNSHSIRESRHACWRPLARRDRHHSHKNLTRPTDWWLWTTTTSSLDWRLSTL